jgi:hypothetical protein
MPFPILGKHEKIFKYLSPFWGSMKKKFKLPTHVVESMKKFQALLPCCGKGKKKFQALLSACGKAEKNFRGPLPFCGEEGGSSGYPGLKLRAAVHNRIRRQVYRTKLASRKVVVSLRGCAAGFCAYNTERFTRLTGSPAASRMPSLATHILRTVLSVYGQGFGGVGLVTHCVANPARGLFLSG